MNFVSWKLKKEVIDKIRAHSHYAKMSACFVLFTIILLAESGMAFKESWTISVLCIIFATVSAHVAFNIAYFRVFEIEPVIPSEEI